jgi:hypothetical protein
MDYIRRYLRRFGHQKEQNQSDSKTNPNKIEEKNDQEKAEENTNNKSTYLQKLVDKNNNSQNTSAINLASVNTSLPSFATNLRDILTTEENKQRAIKYLIQKRHEQKYGLRSPLTTENSQEESNPVLSTKYKNARNMNINANKENNQPEVSNFKINSDSKYQYPYYYGKRNNQNIIENNNQNINNNVNNYKEQNQNIYPRRRFILSSSVNNINNNANIEMKEENNNHSVYYRKNLKNSVNMNENNEERSKIREIKDEIRPKYKYLIYGKRNEIEQNNRIENNSKENNSKENNKNIDSIPINLNIGKSFSFGNQFDELSNSLSIKQKNSSPNLEETNTSKGSRRLNIYENKNLIKVNDIEIKILSDKDNTGNSRYRRKYGRFARVNDENLSFKDEKEIINYITKKYTQDKIVELFSIKNDENEKNKKELEKLKNKFDEELKKNKEIEKKLKDFDEEIEKLKYENISYEKEIKTIKKENDKLKEELENKKRKKKIMKIKN